MRFCFRLSTYRVEQHFVNALIEKDTSRLDKVAVIRLCGPFTRGCPPFAGFPQDLKAILQGPVFMCEGGLQIDGSEISTVDPDEIKRVCKVLREQVSAFFGIRSR